MTVKHPPQIGWYWHVHHDTLIEWCYGYDVRVKVIRETKPHEEWALRLRLMRPVVGPVPAVLDQARAAFTQAVDAYKQARAVYTQADAAYIQAVVVLNQTAALPEIAQLHKTECPDCPWNGQTIFSKDATS